MLAVHVHIQDMTSDVKFVTACTIPNNNNNILLTSEKILCRQIYFCGEVVTTSLLKRCIATLPWVRYINLYSISECHDISMIDLTDTFEKNKVTYLFVPLENDILFLNKRPISWKCHFKISNNNCSHIF